MVLVPTTTREFSASETLATQMIAANVSDTVVTYQKSAPAHVAVKAAPTAVESMTRRDALIATEKAASTAPMNPKKNLMMTTSADPQRKDQDTQRKDTKSLNLNPRNATQKKEDTLNLKKNPAKNLRKNPNVNPKKNPKNTTQRRDAQASLNLTIDTVRLQQRKRVKVRPRFLEK